MSLRRADLRFALPRPVRSAVVLGGLEAWAEGLRAAGVEVGETGVVPDVAVAPAALAPAALLTGAEAVLLEGRGGRRPLARAGLDVRRYLPLPGLDAPDLVLPLDRRGPARYALERWRPAEGTLRRARNRAVARLVETGAFPDLRPVQTVGLRAPGPPFLVAAAGSLGVPPDAGWFMTTGQGDPLTRGVLHLFPAGSPDPVWVLKFARVPGYSEPFDRDERGLRLAGEAAATAAHAPRLVGRLEAEGLHASVETAAVGERLSTLVGRARGGRAALEAIEEIAAWIVRVGLETAAAPAALQEERERLARGVLPRWAERGASRDLVDRLPELPAVLQHNDLGTWNVVAGEEGFTVLDWESARRHGLPLWDLLYFLVDVLPQLDGARSAEERSAQALRLLRGEAASSPVLFAWLRRAVEEMGIPPEAVGPVATLCWLDHGLSHVARSVAAERIEAGSAGAVPPVERIAPAWLADPALGPAWDRWRA